MGNHRRAEVQIEVGGETHTLKLNFNKVCEVEALLGGRSLLSSDVIGSMSSIRAILFVGLRDGMKGLSMQKVGKMIDDTEDFDSVATGIIDAIKMFYGMNDEEEGIKAGEDSGTA